MNAPEARFPAHFQYFPGHYRWSAEMLVVLSTAPFGGAEISEVDRVGRALRDKAGDDEAWFDEWVKGADLKNANGVKSSIVASCHQVLLGSSLPHTKLYFQSHNRNSFRLARTAIKQQRAEHAAGDREGVKSRAGETTYDPPISRLIALCPGSIYIRDCGGGLGEQECPHRLGAASASSDLPGELRGHSGMSANYLPTIARQRVHCAGEPRRALRSGSTTGNVS
jgi:hypothetical protein